MYERILVPTDGSVGSAHVALQAIDIAETYGATIHVVHVVDESLRTLVGGQTDETELEDRGREVVDRVAGMARDHGIDVETAILHGDPAQRIVAYADEMDADLIVSGTHGRSGVERRLIGSVAERLVRQARCPVMTVRLPETNVTVDDKDEAMAIARDALEREGIDATVAAAERQVSVWVVDAESEADSYLIYVDPVTQRTSIIS
ncbi:universal stress protein [Halomicroarcula sp. GCM10025817]|uniref:universal stress protein n=1 Tax=Haloarcula TaxID=2237 RepID=UPI0023E80604|nr:universal stress protein [Halomicroarcula sp. SYNS111]